MRSPAPNFLATFTKTLLIVLSFRSPAAMISSWSPAIKRFLVIRTSKQLGKTTLPFIIQRSPSSVSPHPPNFLCIRRGEGNPQLPQLQELSLKMLTGAASAQGITTPEDFEAWMTRSQLNEPAVFLPRLNQRLEDLVGDGWLFKREGL